MYEPGMFGKKVKRPKTHGDDPATLLTKREEFAKAAMQAMLSNSDTVNEIKNSAVNLQQCAVICADALIEALNK